MHTEEMLYANSAASTASVSKTDYQTIIANRTQNLIL